VLRKRDPANPGSGAGNIQPPPDGIASMPRLRESNAPTETLEDAYDAERRVVALTIADREAVLRVLEDAPDGLAELRGVLLREAEWRRRERLV
jgi:hypothetical protein